MKKVFYSLCAATLLLAACDGPEDLTYRYGDVFCYYPPELSVTEERIQNGVHVVFKKDDRNFMLMDIQDMGDRYVDMSNEDVQASIEKEAEQMFNDVKARENLTLTATPFFEFSYPDRWSPERKFEREWRYEGVKGDSPCYGTVSVMILESYKLTMHYEATSQDGKTPFALINTTLRLKPEE